MNPLFWTIFWVVIISLQLFFFFKAWQAWKRQQEISKQFRELTASLAKLADDLSTKR